MSIFFGSFVCGPAITILSSISATKEGGAVVNLIGKALVERIVRAAQEGKKFQVIICIPELPAFAGSVKDDSSLKTIMAGQYRTMNRGGSSIYEEIRKAGYEPWVLIILS